MSNKTTNHLCCIFTTVFLFISSAYGQDKPQVIKLTVDEANFLLSTLAPRQNESTLVIRGDEVDQVMEMRAALRTITAQTDTTKKSFDFPVSSAQRSLCLRAINGMRYMIWQADAVVEFKARFSVKAENGEVKKQP